MEINFLMPNTQLKISSTYHPKKDGHTKIVNKFLKTCLFYLAFDHQEHWTGWSLLVEWWFNTIYYTTTKMPPYEAMHGQSPPSL